MYGNSVWSSVHLGCGEAEQPKACVDQPVLAAVVIDEAITMVATVVFNSQALNAIKQVWTPQETTFIVTEGNLNLRPRKSGKHQELRVAM